jgi:glycosyltransferase involved in cell wall biosynthesis
MLVFMDHQFSIIIPHYNDLENLVRCVDLLWVQSLDRVSFEIVVADNNSRIGIEVVRRTVGDRARVVEAPEQGAGPARNAGVTASTGALLVFIDSDCLPSRDWLERGLSALNSADIVGGRVDVVARDPTRPSPVEAFEVATAFPVRDYVERKGFAVTANLFTTRATFEAVGPFRSTVAEDIDWCHRAVAMGYRLGYADDVPVTHPARKTWAELSRKWRRTTAETFALAMDQPLGRRLWLTQCLLVLASIAPHGAKMLVTPKLRGARARLGAVLTLVRIRWFRVVLGLKLLWGQP